MTGFPMVPRFKGNTDDDDSFHLHKTVGKSNPIQSVRTSRFMTTTTNTTNTTTPINRVNISVDDKISQILDSSKDDEIDFDETHVHNSYLQYLNGDYNQTYDEDDDLDFVLSDTETYREGRDVDDDEPELDFDFDRFHEKSVFNESSTNDDIPPKSENIDKKSQKKFIWKFSLLAFLGTFVITIIAYLIATNYYPFIDPTNFNDPSGKLRRLNQELQKTNDLQQVQQQQLLQVQREIEQLTKKLGKIQPESNVISFRNNQIQISPEFHQFLYHFIDNYHSLYIDEKLQGFEKLKDLKELEKYVDKLISESAESIKQDVRLEIDNLFDNLTIVNNTIVEPNTSKVWIDSILNLISRGSTLVNYADYSCGARILGFLTKSQEKSDKYNLLEKMVYGWWIFNENLTDDQYNANHVLLDDDVSWKGGEEIGIRVSNGIIPSDIIIECDTKQEQMVAVGFKPSTKAGFDKLEYGKIDESQNKYISKFKKIKQVKIKSGINHIRLPIRFINMKITGKDFYFKFEHELDINSIKVYGISEINAIKYQDKLSLLVDKFNEAINEDPTPAPRDNHRPSVEVYDLNDDIYL
ncbi:hypothetical protein G210_1030, partial [Candida maltosa Xu316]